MTCVTEFIEFKDPDGHPLALSYGFEIDKGQKWGQRPLLPFPECMARTPGYSRSLSIPPAMQTGGNVLLFFGYGEPVGFYDLLEVFLRFCVVIPVDQR